MLTDEEYGNLKVIVDVGELTGNITQKRGQTF